MLELLLAIIIVTMYSIALGLDIIYRDDIGFYIVLFTGIGVGIYKLIFVGYDIDVLVAALMVATTNTLVERVKITTHEILIASMLSSLVSPSPIMFALVYMVLVIFHLAWYMRERNGQPPFTLLDAKHRIRRVIELMGETYYVAVLRIGYVSASMYISFLYWWVTKP